MKLFDRKISDTTTSGFNSQEVADWLDKVEKIDEFKYYYFTLGAKRATESEDLKDQPVAEVLYFLNDRFMDSTESFVEIQKKVFSSGRHEVIFRLISAVLDKREITKLAVLNYSKPTSKEIGLENKRVVR